MTVGGARIPASFQLQSGGLIGLRRVWARITRGPRNSSKKEKERKKECSRRVVGGSGGGDTARPGNKGRNPTPDAAGDRADSGARDGALNANQRASYERIWRDLRVCPRERNSSLERDSGACVALGLNGGRRGKKRKKL